MNNRDKTAPLIDFARARRELLTAIEANHRARAIADAIESALLCTAFEICVAAKQGESSRALDNELRSIAAEIGMLTRRSERTILARIDEAAEIHRNFPSVAKALLLGEIDVAHARVIARCGAPLQAAESRSEYEQLAIDQAAQTTPGRLEKSARRFAAELEPEVVAERQQRARRERGVRVTDLEDGMSLLIAELPSVFAHAIHDRLTELARVNARERKASMDAFGRVVPGEGGHPAQRDVRAGAGINVRAHEGKDTQEGAVQEESSMAGESRLNCEAADFDATGDDRNANDRYFDDPNLDDPSSDDPNFDDPSSDDPNFDDPHSDDRNFDAVRADALVDLLLAGFVPTNSPHSALNSIQARVAITVPALAAVGASDEPAVLDGTGPIPLDTAMALCGAAALWTRVLTDPISGEALAADTYRPSAALRRFIESRDQHCRAPGCRRPARDADLDHTVEWIAGGKTTHDNLSALCRAHHTMKHRGWTLRQTSRGELEWTSPNGRRYADRPDRIAKPWNEHRVTQVAGVGAAEVDAATRDDSAVDAADGVSGIVESPRRVPEPPSVWFRPTRPPNDDEEPPPF